MVTGGRLGRRTGGVFSGSASGTAPRHGARQATPHHANSGDAGMVSGDTSPYAIGQGAAASGLDENACPFDRNSSAAEAWLAGHRGE